jgi:hypothetical protein
MNVLPIIVTAPIMLASAILGLRRTCRCKPTDWLRLSVEKEY